MARSNELNEWLDNWSEKIDGKKENPDKGSLRIWNKLKFNPVKIMNTTIIDSTKNESKYIMPAS